MKKLLISLLAAIVSLIGSQTSHAEEYFFDEISGMDVRKEMVSVDTDFQIHNPSMTYPICKIKAGTEVWVPRNQLYSGSGRLIVKGTLAQPCDLTVVVSTNPLTIEQRQLPANATFYIKGGDVAGGGVIKLETETVDYSRSVRSEICTEINSIESNITSAINQLRSPLYTEDQKNNIRSDITFYEQRLDGLRAELQKGQPAELQTGRPTDKRFGKLLCPPRHTVKTYNPDNDYSDIPAPPYK